MPPLAGGIQPDTLPGGIAAIQVRCCGSGGLHSSSVLLLISVFLFFSLKFFCRGTLPLSVLVHKYLLLGEIATFSFSYFFFKLRLACLLFLHCEFGENY